MSDNVFTMVDFGVQAVALVELHGLRLHRLVLLALALKAVGFVDLRLNWRRRQRVLGACGGDDWLLRYNIAPNDKLCNIYS